MDTVKLGIPLHRRVAGGVFLVLFCAIAPLYLSPPAWFASAIAAELNPAYVGIFIGVGTAWCLPTVFYPCLFDRFPRWVMRHPTLARRAAARLGVKLPEAPRPLVPLFRD